MSLPRVHLFELEDQPWFPAMIRDLATDYLRYVEHKFQMHKPAVELVGNILRLTGEKQIVDLCSGGGGSIAELLQGLQESGLTPNAVLTDKFPNLGAFEEVAKASGGQLSYCAEPVDATEVSSALSGMRTLFNSFHHFKPEDAVAILQDAVEARQPIGIFEISERSWRNVLPALFLIPLMVAVLTPFIRPFQGRRLLWTYLIPLVPGTCWWDGVVSMLRAYTPSELEALANKTRSEGYQWRAGQTRLQNMPAKMTYLLGFPMDL